MIEFNGKKYARVTEILSPYADFSHIKPEVLANKCRIGTEVHSCIEDDIKGDFPCPSPDCAGYFESFCKWRDHLKPEFIASEQRYFCDKRMITGQIDCLVKFEGDKLNLPVLVDFKTSAQESKETWPMQAHMYNYLLASNGIVVGPGYLFIKLDKNGAMPTVFRYMWNSNSHNKCMLAIDIFWQNHNSSSI